MDRKGWIECSIGEACKDIFAGGDVPKTAFSKEKTESCPIPIFSNGVENDGLYGYTDAPRVTEPCVTISGRGTIGNCVLHVKPFYPIIRLISAIPKDTIDIRYFYYALSSIKFKSTGVTIPQLTVPAVKSYRFTYPVEIEEQQRIVAELDLLSSIVKKKNAQLKILDDLAQSIFHEMFGDPIANERGWDYKRLDEVAEIVGGATPKTQIEEYWVGDNYWVTPAELHKEHYKGATERTISDEAVRKTNVTLLPVGTVLLSSRAPIGKVAITTVPMYCNQGFKNLICSEKLNNEYAFQVLYSKTEYLNSLGTGATFKEISKKTTEAIKIAVPPIELQKQFAEMAKKIQAEKEMIKTSLESAEQLFASRLDNYFNV